MGNNVNQFKLVYSRSVQTVNMDNCYKFHVGKIQRISWTEHC